MDKVSRKVFLVIACGYAFSFAFLYSYSLIVFSPKATLQQYFWQWVFDNASILFLTTLIPVTSAVLTLSYSLFLSQEELRRSDARTHASFFSIIRGVLPVLMIFLALDVLLTESTLPGLYGKHQEMAYRTERSRNLLTETQKAVEAGKPAEARESLLEYLQFNPDDRNASEQLDAITRRLDDSGSGDNGNGKSAPQAPGSSPMDASKLITEALAYLDHEDFYSAHYYASIASRIDPSRTEPKRIMALAWGKITAPGPDKQSREQQLLYERKREGYAALMKGDALEAYAIFSSLRSVYPSDPDVGQYYRKSAAMLEEESFFIDEVENITRLFGKRDLLFRNSRDGTSTELIYMKKLVVIKGEFYAENVEAISFETDGKVKYHLTAPYGKITGKRLLLHAVDRNDPGRQLVPEYFEGSRETGFTGIINLETTPEYLFGLSTQENTLKTLSLPQLYALSSEYNRFGYRKETAQLELLDRMMFYFNFIVISFLSIGMGWMLRSRYHSRMPLVMYAAVPFLPFALHYLIRIFFYVQEIGVSFFLLAGNFTAGACFLILLELSLLFAALVFLSGQVVGNE